MISTENASRYTWGTNCLGYHLLKNKNLGIIQEIMPPFAEEELHIHKYAQQFFYILKGVATFTIDGNIEEIRSNEGVYIEPGKIHKIINNTNKNLEFLVISEPHSHGDRVNITKS